MGYEPEPLPEGGWDATVKRLRDRKPRRRRSRLPRIGRERERKQLLSCGKVTKILPLMTSREDAAAQLREFSLKYCRGKKKRVVDLNGPMGGTQIGARGVLNAYLAATDERKPWEPSSFKKGAPGTMLADPGGVTSSVAERLSKALGLKSPLEAICGGPDLKGFISCGPFVVKLKPGEERLTLRELINGPCCDGRQRFDGDLKPITTPAAHPQCGALTLPDWIAWSGPKHLIRPLPPTTRSGAPRRRTVTLTPAGVPGATEPGLPAPELVVKPPVVRRNLISCGLFQVELAPGESYGTLRELILGPCSDGRQHYDGAGNPIP